jgi:hypothetical protein
MKRFDFDADEAVEDMTGEWVRWRDANTEIERLKERLAESEQAHKELMDRFSKYLGGVL